MRSSILRVGSVPYLVGRPLDSGLEHEPEFHVERRVPAELVTALRAGELDVALVSSIELFRRPGYRYLDGIAVAGAGFVGSVQVFLRRPIESVRTIALDPASAAAATLVQVLLAPRATGRAAVDFVAVDARASARDAGTDAWLAIGDPALRETLSQGALPAFNPSAEWHRTTGLPFVFATWIVRPGVELTPEHLAAFARARVRGGAQVEGLATRASREWSLPRAACEKYLREECRYEPGPDMERALFAFRDRAAALGLCEQDLRPAAIQGVTAHVT
ncbi:MAG: menaquinone biosynthetic enzyme MqnA/MqnD family protein [Planctomycetota bacterium]